MPHYGCPPDIHGGRVTIGKVSFSVKDAPSWSEGQLYYDERDRTLVVDGPNGSSYSLGQEQVVQCVNKTGSTISDSKAVYISGAQGNRPTASLASASSSSTSMATIGLATQDIANNQEGPITTQGLVRNVDTSAWSEGDRLYLSTVAGELTNVQPPSPNHGVAIGFVLNSHATQGLILVYIQNQGDLGDIHDVYVPSPNDNDALVFNSSTGRWEASPPNVISTLADTGAPDKTVTVEDDGTLVTKGYWDDLDRGINDVNLTGPASPPTLNTSKFTLDFSPSATNTVFVNYQLKHEYKEGTNVKFHVHWSPSNTDTGNVYWELYWRWFNADAPMGAWNTDTLAAPANGTIDDMQISAIKEMNGSGKKISSFIQVRLQRLGGDAQDTFTGNAQVVSMDVHFQKDAPGSEHEFIK